jgi:hypothetical protein
MTRVLVGVRGGRRVINWRAVLLVGLVVGLVGGGAGAAMWFLLTKEFRVSTVLFAFALSVGWVAGTAVRDYFRLPPEQLTVLK